MPLSEKIEVDASGVLTGVATLNTAIASIGESLGRLNVDLGKTQQAINILDQRFTKSLRSSRDAAIQLSRAANETTAAVQKAVSGLASIDSALEKRVQRVRELRQELQVLAGTSLTGGGGPRGPRVPTGPAGSSPDGERNIARLGDMTRFTEQLTRQFFIIAQSRAFFLVAGGMEESVRAAKDLNERITEIQTISQQASRTTLEWQKSLIGLSNELGKPVAEVADATYQALSNNIRGAQGNTDKLIKTTGDFARITRSDLKGAVDSVSSVLNSYNRTVDEASDVTAVFFKGIELGRFRADELAPAIGKVAPSAAQAGVSLEELAASFVVLTDQGLNLQTSSTLVLNVLNALLKPSEAMRHLFDEFGVSTGQAFIQSQSFAGILNILANRAKGASKEFSDLFGNIRGQRGAIGLTVDIGRFNEALREVGNKRSVQVALEIEANSQNRSIDQFSERLKNRLIEDFGFAVNSLLGFLAKIDNKSGIASGFVLPAAEIAGTAAVLGGLASLIAKNTSAQNAFLQAVILTESVSKGTATAFLAIGAALGPIIAGLTIGLILGTKLGQQSEAELRIINLQNRALKERSELALAGRGSGNAGLADQVNEQFKVIQNASAKARIVITNSFDIARANVRNSFEKTSGDLSSFLDRARQKVSELNREISQTFREQENARKSIGDFRAQAEQSFLNLKIDLATPQQQLQLIADEIDRLRNKGATLLNKAGSSRGPESEEFAREGKADFDAALQLANQLLQKKQQLRGEGQLNISNTLLLSQHEDTLLSIVSKQRDAMRNYAELRGKVREQAEADKIIEERKSRDLEQQIKLLTEIQHKISQGTIGTDKDFQTKGVFDVNKVREKLFELNSIIAKSLFNIDKGAAAAASAGLAKTVNDSLQAVGLTILKNDADRQEKQEIQERAAALNRVAALKEVNSALNATLTNKDDASALPAIIKNLQDVRENLRSLPKTGLFERTDPNELKRRAEEALQLKEIIPFLQQLQTRRPDAKGNIILTPEELDQLKSARDLVNTIAEQKDRLTKGGTTSSLEPVVADIDRLINQAKGVRTTIEEVRGAQSLLDDLNNAAINAPRDVAQALNELATFSTQSENVIKTALESTNSSLQQRLDLLRLINQEIQSPNSNGVNNNAPIPGNSQGGTVFGRGADQILTLQRPGEIVMNPGASATYAPLLQGLNRLSAIPYGTSNSNVTVGDVNVFVNGANTPEMNVRAIARGIQRELRRGNIR